MTGSDSVLKTPLQSTLTIIPKLTSGMFSGNYNGITRSLIIMQM